METRVATTSLDVPAQTGQTYLVVPDGDDHNDGTIEHPFATVEHAIRPPGTTRWRWNHVLAQPPLRREGGGPAGEGEGLGDVEGDPRVTKPRGRKAGHFRLPSSSPAIGVSTPAGIDFFGNERPYGNRFDIGTHDFSRGT